MKIFTIGFTRKSAKQFFELLKLHQIKILADIRLNNVSQLAGFAKGNDLKYFTKEICSTEYVHMLELAPTKEILDGYKKNIISWEEYEKLYMELLEKRSIKETFESKIKPDFDRICLLCSEAVPDKCHRRLASEFIKNAFKEQDIEIVHI